jgi:hypothetical protein
MPDETEKQEEVPQSPALDHQARVDASLNRIEAMLKEILQHLGDAPGTRGLGH